MAGAAALALYRAELNERLVVHRTGGAWRVPLATRHLDVRAADGSRLGRIVCGDAADAARALAGLRPAPPPAAGRLAEALAEVAPFWRAVRALEGVETADAAGSPDLWPAPQATGPVLLVTRADAPAGAIARALAGHAATGAVWVPDPVAAASSHLLARVLAPLLGPAFALIQGDGATVRAFAGLGLSPADGCPGPR